MRNFLKNKKRLLCAVLASTTLAGCANHPINPQEIRTNVPKKYEAINMLNDPAVTTLETESSSFWTTDYDRGDPLPNIMIGGVSFNNTSVDDAIKLITTKTNIGFTETAIPRTQTITLNIPNSIPLKTLMEIIGRQAGLFYEYRDGILSFTPTRKFIVKLPRTYGSLLTFSEGFRNLGCTNIYTDVITGSVTMDADYRSYREAQRFLKNFEVNRDMLVYDIWILEHRLDRNEGAGVSWKSLGFKAGGTTLGFGALSAQAGSSSGSGYGSGSNSSSSSDSSSTSTSSSSGSASQAASTAANALGMVTTAAASQAASGLQFGIISNASGRIANAMLSALSNDGRTDTVARPTLAMMSGGQEHFQVGDKQQYIGQVSNNSNGGFSGGSTQGINPSTLETGIKMTIGGGYNDGIISTKLSLDINELIDFTPFSTGGSGSGNGSSSSSSSSSSSTNSSSNGNYTLQLPHTTNRILHSQVDARPGDVIVLGGLIRTSYADAQQRIYHTNIPVSASMVAERTETIIFMRPRLIRIRPKGTPSLAPNEVRIAPWVGRNIKTKTGPLILGSNPMDIDRIVHDATDPMPPVSTDTRKNKDLIFDKSTEYNLPTGPKIPYQPRPVDHPLDLNQTTGLKTQESTQPIIPTTPNIPKTQETYTPPQDINPPTPAATPVPSFGVFEKQNNPDAKAAESTPTKTK